jgi:hypothetical protein
MSFFHLKTMQGFYPQRDSIVEFTPPENLDDSDGLGCLVVERDAPEEIPISRLSEDLFGKRRIRITFDMWTCYTSFFLPHLTVPWSPTVGQDQGLEERYYWSTEALS